MIKRIKIFSIDKFKAKQRMLKVAFTGTIAAAILSGCSSKLGSYEAHVDAPVTYETTTDDYTDVNTYEEIDFGEYNNMMDTKVYLDSDDVASELNYIDNYQVTYEGSETFGIEKALASYEKVDRSDNSSTYSMTLDEMVKIVKANNTKYLASKDSNFYKELSDSDLKKICEGVLKSVEYETSNRSISTGNLQNKFNNLKVLGYSSFGYAFNNPAEDILAFNIKSIEAINKDNAFERLVSHESKHFLQANQNGDSYEYAYGTGYRFNDDSLGIQNEFLYEASAESMAMQELNDDETLLYEDALRGLNAIKSSYILSGNALELESLTFQNDINKIYEYFGCKTESEKMEILTMLNAYTLTKDFPSARDYYEAHKMDTTAQNDYKNSLSNSIASTLSKQFYKDLAKRLENNDTYLLKDVFAVVRMQEMSLVYDMPKSSNSFSECYGEMQDMLFQDIADNLGIDYQDVKDAYMEYVNSASSYQPSSLLTDDENKFLEKQYNSISWCVGTNMLNTSELYMRSM